MREFRVVYENQGVSAAWFANANTEKQARKQFNDWAAAVFFGTKTKILYITEVV